MKHGWPIALGCLALFLSACGGNLSGDLGDSSSSGFLGDGSGSNTQTSSSIVDASALAVGDSVSFSLDSQNNSKLTFGSTDEDTQYLLVMATPSASGDSAFSFTLASENATPDESLTTEKEMTADGTQESSPDFHDYMRTLEETLPAPDATSLDRNTKALMVTPSRVTVGSQKTFQVLNALGNVDSCTSITASAVLVTDHIALYVDSRVSLSEDEITTYQNLDPVIAEEIEIGGEPGDGDNNGVINAVITPVVNAIPTTGGGIVTGFYNPIDQYASSKYHCSNQAEAVYLIAPDSSKKYSNVSVSDAFWQSNFSFTLQHEVQHLINYHQRVFVLGSLPESSWLNEALSHKIEDLRSGSDFQEIGLENPSRVLKFLQDPSGTNMTAGTNLAQRGEGYLFLNYLFDQADKGSFSTVDSGKELLSALIASDQKGTDNIEAATGEKFETLFGRFALAMAESGRSFTNDPVYNFGLNLYNESFDDNRGTTWHGPTESDYSEGSFSVSLNSIGFVSISGEDITESGGTLEIRGGAASGVIGHIVRVN